MYREVRYTRVDPRGSNVPKSRNNVIWCQETFTNSQKRWKVLETIFGCGSKHLKGTADQCGSLRIMIRGSCGSSKSRLNGSISFLIENSWGKRRANTKTKVLVSQTNLVCGSKCHLDISGTNVPRGTVHSGWPCGSNVPKITNNVIWCQETFRNSRQHCRVLGTMFGWGWKQF